MRSIACIDESDESAFSATVFNADGFEGLFLRVAVSTGNATWNGEARIERGEATLAIPAAVLAGANEYSVHTWIDVDGDGVAGLDDASWLSTFDARHGRTDVSLDASRD